MKELTLNEVISKYIEKGFGSMNKMTLKCGYSIIYWSTNFKERRTMKSA